MMMFRTASLRPGPSTESKKGIQEIFGDGGDDMLCSIQSISEGKAMRPFLWVLRTSLVLGALLSACGGGGGSSSAPVVLGKSVYWAPPQFFTDSTTPLVPSRDLQGYEIYVKQVSSFGPADNAVATPAPLDTSFYLGNITPPLTQGVTYYLSLRTVTVYGLKSDFSPAASFSPP